MADRKEFKHDDQFPDNVNPSEENRKAFSDQVEADRKAIEKDGQPEDGVKVGGEVVGEEPKAKSTRQTGTVSK